MGQSWDEDGLRLSGPEARPSMPKGPRHQGAYINRGWSSNAKGPRHQGAYINRGSSSNAQGTSSSRCVN
jgi:hypothetical protein